MRSSRCLGPLPHRVYVLPAREGLTPTLNPYGRAGSRWQSWFCSRESLRSQAERAIAPVV